MGRLGAEGKWWHACLRVNSATPSDVQGLGDLGEQFLFGASGGVQGTLGRAGTWDGEGWEGGMRVGAVLAGRWGPVGCTDEHAGGGEG